MRTLSRTRLVVAASTLLVGDCLAAGAPPHVAPQDAPGSELVSAAPRHHYYL